LDDRRLRMKKEKSLKYPFKGVIPDTQRLLVSLQKVWIGERLVLKNN